eukprot:IDg5179t1
MRERGTFEIVHESEAGSHRIYGCRFVDKIKDQNRKRSMLYVAAYNDKDHGLFVLAPTIRQGSLRILLSICTVMRWKAKLRDIVKAFVASRTRLRRPIFMRAPKEMNLAEGIKLRVVLPLYGNPAGILGLQVDDTLFAGSKQFLDKEDAAAETFPNKGA